MFWITNLEKLQQEWGNYKPELYKRVEMNLLKLLSWNMSTLIFEHVKWEKITGDENIKKSIKYWCSQLIRDNITETVGRLKNNEIKWLNNRFYLSNYEILNNICEKVFYQLTTT